MQYIKQYLCRTVAVGLMVLFVLAGWTKQTEASTTTSRLQQAQDKKNEAENNLNDTKENISSLNSERASLQAYVEDLNDQLMSASTQLSELEGLVAEKETQIKETQQALEKAKKAQVEQYAAMKTRIKFMYECGDTAYLELFFSASSFSEFLNKNDYVAKLTEYDRKMLEEYVELQEEIAKEETELQDSKTALKALQADADEKAESVSTVVAEASKNLNEYLDQISEQEKQMMAYEAELNAQNNNIQNLEAELAAQKKLSDASVMSDLSTVTISGGDIDLMAAIIECEAGGESYTGKVAVGAVVLNRVKSSSFPNTVLEVIYQNRQFSPVASGRFAVVLARGANESCYQAARDAMSGVSPVGDKLFFRTPIPGLTGQQIGGHIFY